MTVVGAVLLVAAAGALLAAGRRVAGAAGAEGLAALVGAVAVAAAAAGAQGLVLGRLGLSGSGVLLAALAVATWAVARALLPAPPPLPVPPPRHRRATGALAGGGAALVAWQLLHPYVGPDGWLYHLPIAAAWAQDGDAGSVVEAVAGLPVGHYPVTNELLQAWTLALAGSWAPVSVWTVALAGVGAAGLWLALRGLGGAASWTAVAVGAVAALPVAATALGAPNTDVPALAWACAAAGLAVTAANGTPAVLGLALVAAGLSVGTKTTAALPLALVLAWALPRTRPLPARPLLAGAALGALVGLPWMVRNVLEHGSPLWPLVALPGGDPLPPVLRPLATSFAGDPAGLLRRHGTGYAELLAGGIALLAGAAGVLALARARAARAAAAIALVAALAWTLAPYTGIDQAALAPGALRYLLPALAAAAAALALAATDARPAARAVARTALVLALAVSLARSFAYGFPYLPSPVTVALGAGLGAAAAPLARRRLAPLAAAGLAAALAAAAPGYLARHATAGLADAGLVRAALARPAFERGRLDIAMGPATVGLLRGDRLQHRLRFAATCTDARGADWLVLQARPPTAAYAALRRCAPGRPAWTDGTFELFTTARRGAP